MTILKVLFYVAVASAADIRVSSNLVLIPVSVTDSRNHPVTGLDAGQFRVFEGKAEQRVVHVSANDAPLSVGIVFDASGSMADKLSQARQAVVGFLRGANPEDEFFLVTFNDRAEVAVPFTGGAGEIQNRLMYVKPKGKTALLDAVSLALTEMKEARNPRKALLILSDGGDNDSRYTATALRRALREAEVWVYAVGVYGGGNAVLAEEERGGPQLLTELAEETGGRHLAVRTAAELPEAVQKIGLELRNQYLVGFQPGEVTADGRFHRVRVGLVDSGGRSLWWRPGYYAPSR